jgi:hypothetical protein
MGVSEDIIRALRREKWVKALPPPACSGATVSRIRDKVKGWREREVKPLCMRCGWWEEGGCSSRLSKVEGRKPIDKDGVVCEWFEENSTVNRGLRGYIPDGPKGKQRWKPKVENTWWGV